MEYRIGGSILGIRPENIVDKLKEMYPKLIYRQRALGYNIELERDDFDFYINTLDYEEYLLEATFYSSEKDLLLFLGGLKKIFLSLNVKFNIWYCLEDEDGNEISPEINYFDNYINV